MKRQLDHVHFFEAVPDFLKPGNPMTKTFRSTADGVSISMDELFIYVSRNGDEAVYGARNVMSARPFPEADEPAKDAKTKK